MDGFFFFVDGVGAPVVLAFAVGGGPAFEAFTIEEGDEAFFCFFFFGIGGGEGEAEDEGGERGEFFHVKRVCFFEGRLARRNFFGERVMKGELDLGRSCC